MNNSFAAQHPELICEWSEKNLPLTPDRVSYGSNKRVWWRAACGHEWQTRAVLRKGEVQRENGTYHYSWTDRKGKRHFVYAKTLEELRRKEEEIDRDRLDGIKAEARYTTINELFDLWKQLKRGLKKQYL